MYNEDVFRRKNEVGGSIEVICGSMFSGKTEELIRRVKRARIAKVEVEIFSPAADIRYDKQAVVSHNANSIPSKSVTKAAEILQLADHIQVIGVDEAQFFDDELPQIAQALANKGVRVIIAGLDMDFKGRPFGTMPQLMAMADAVTKLHAVCMKCGGQAMYSYRLVPNESQILLGEKETYEARCRECYHLDGDI
ncbi:thymidine kinase [Mucilaginibacter sp.]|uniref:thymidine kinase n=1 Tax=Mucilaginibacter sp. TaxID=1882438 RepID=UPI000CAF7D67|nr:thymidine kinase [Mucilaginibacter sp.]PLW88651.1 MAG: thymidine kinase [Mucilaginibacter sp.]HEK21597.1 thymidine kinase [Bacteroidota bacterium]